MDRLTVSEAAERLGITQEAVRKRVQRDTIRWEKDSEGRLYVYLDTPRTADQDMSRHIVLEAKDEVISELRDRVEHLEKIIDTRDEEIRRRDIIITQLTQRIPAIEAPKEEPVEPRESPVSASEDEAKGQVPLDMEKRSWWQRMFGG